MSEWFNENVEPAFRILVADVPALIRQATAGGGARLRAARRLRGWTLEEVATRYNDGLSAPFQIKTVDLRSLEYVNHELSPFVAERLSDVIGVRRAWLTQGETFTLGSLTGMPESEAAVALKNIGWRP